MSTVVIVGSSRNDGNAKRLTSQLIGKAGWDVMDLNDYSFSYFDYRHQNAEDDYLGLMKKILDTYDTLVLVTPVYWYAMSGIMKVFFDRLTDLLTIEKELGRKLRGKNMAALSTSNGDHLLNLHSANRLPW